ncbi:MAG: hypothetical protein ACRDQA_03480 [Nocardioidaceae bacterium]
MTLAQDHSDTSLLSIIWDQAGDEVGGVYAPYGNEDPSTMQPHYSFTAIVSEPDGDYLGAEADKSTTAVATTEVEWKLTGKPTKITTAA